MIRSATGAARSTGIAKGPLLGWFFRFAVDDSKPDRKPAIGDHDALRRAVGNLLSNSVRMAPAGSQIVIGAGRADSWLWLGVRDSGPGIPAEEQTRVFDRFWRGVEPTDPGQRHTGLGLAIVRQIVESHGGQVRLFSVRDAGSSFVLWLPGPAGRPSALPEHNPLAGD